MTWKSGKFAAERSKQSEPPPMYGIGAYFAIRNAIKAVKNGASPEFDVPFTPEKVLLNLYGKIK